MLSVLLFLHFFCVKNIKNTFHSVFRLHKCKLDGECCEALAAAFSTESTQLKELDLSANDFREAGLKGLCMGLCSHNCKLETVRLDPILPDIPK